MNTASTVSRIKSLAANLSVRPIDTSTAEGRAKDRQRRIAWTAIASFGAKAVALLTSLVSVRLTVNYLGEERFGMWAMLSSFVSLLMFTDLGIGNGLLNAVSDANGRDDRAEAQRSVASAFFLLLMLALCLLVIFFVLYPVVNWSKIFNVTSAKAVGESAPVIAVFAACFLINLPIGIVQRIQLGYQEGFVNSLWIAVGNVLGLAGVLGVIYFRGGLPYLVLALVGAPIIAQLLNGAFLFGFKRPWLLPRPRFFSTIVAKRILKLGFLFFVLQTAVAVGFQSDNLVIAQIMGAEAVTQYAVPMRLFSMITVLLGIMLAPIWPAYGEALAREDIGWVKRALSRSLIASLAIAVPLVAVLVMFGKSIVEAWVGPSVQPSNLLLIGMGCWTILYSILNPVAMFLNGASEVNFQIVTALTMTIVNLLLSVILVRVIGVSGAIWGTVISLSLCTLIPYVWFVPRFIASIGNFSELETTRSQSV